MSRTGIPRRLPAFLARALGVAGVVCLAACAHSLLRSDRPQPAEYALSPRPGPRGPQVLADVKVLTPIVDAGLGTDRIAASFPDRRLDHFAQARWSAPLGAMIEQLAVGEFRARSGLRNAVPDASALQPRYWLEIEVVAFQASYSPAGGPPDVEAHFVARVGDAVTGRVLVRIDARAARRAQANRMAAIVAAFESAADAALGRIVAATDRRLAATPGARGKS